MTRKTRLPNDSPPDPPADDELPLAVYTPESPFSNPVRMLAAIFGDLWRTRELIWILFVRDIKAQFRQSALGYAWLIVPPLVSAAAWSLLHRAEMMNLATGEHNVAQFVVVGTTLWSAFAATMTTPMDAIEGGKGVFTKLNVPIESFILAAAGRAVFNLLISATVLVILLLILGVQPKPTFLMFPVAALAVLATGFTMGMLLAPMSTLYTDVRTAVTSFVGLLMFTVPVIFQVPEESGGLVATVIRNNPMTPAFALSRDTLLTGSLEWLGPTMFWLAGCVPLILIALVVLRVAKPHIIARMGM